MFPVHQVWPKPSCKAQWKGEEDKADRGRGGKTTSGNGQAWSSASPRGQWRTRKMEKTGCKIICGGPTTLAVKGLMMMMMMMMMRKSHCISFSQAQTLDRPKTCKLFPLNTHKSHTNHIVHDLFNVSSNHTTLKLQRTRIQNTQFAV